jgi:hypothetical protein
MADAESLRQALQSRAPFSTWLGVVLLLALFGVIVLAVVGPAPRRDNYEQKRAKEREEKLKTLREANAKELTTYGWIDKNKGVVRLPIDRAMELAVAEFAGKQPVPAYPIATPAASATPAGAAPPTPLGQASGTSKPTSTEEAQSENRGQPAGSANPPGPQAATQPGVAASPAAAPRSSAAVAPVSPSPLPSSSPAGTPLPIRGKTPQ